MKSFFTQFISAVWEVFKLPFDLIGLGFKRMWVLGWQRILMLITAAVALTMVVILLFLEATSQPGFCGSCHIMRPYIASWQTSTHNNVHCMVCHAREGLTGYIETKFTALSMLVNYFTGIYKRSKPWAEIEDRNCLQGGCHATRLLDGKIDFTGVVFDHTPHLTDIRRGRKLRCTSCHSQIVQGEHLTVTTSTCALCHFKNVEAEGRTELADCRKCHKSPPTGRDVPYDHTWVLGNNINCRTCHQLMWQGSGTVRKERCGVCHSQTAHIERIDDLEFIHEWHIEKRKVDCLMCHDPIEHQQPKVAAVIGSDCRACHEDRHAPILALYEGIGARLAAKKMPNAMHESGAVCMSCHKDPFTGNGSARVDKNVCTPCHQASYFKLAEEWRANFARRIAQLESALHRMSSHTHKEDARHDLALVKRGGAWHNPHYADEVLKSVAEVISKAGGNVKTYIDMPAGTEKCTACHSGILDAEIKLELSEFDHSAHIAERKITCTDCHIDNLPEMTGHGRRLPLKSSCRDCHHSANVAGDKLCSPCHIPARRLFSGALPGLEPQPSPMFAADMVCRDCHYQSKGYRPPDNDLCLDCHDAEIVRDLEFKRGVLVNLILKSSSSDLPTRLVEQDKGRAVHNPDLAKKILSR